jgi:hypothetical protein
VPIHHRAGTAIYWRLIWTQNTSDDRADGRRQRRLTSCTLVGGSFDDLSRAMPPDVSDQFVGGFREGIFRVWCGT